MKTKKWSGWLSFLFTALILLLFILLFFADNKYQTPPPYGSRGIITLTETDITQDTPLFLIDGWLITDTRTSQFPTYIGQFGSLQRGNHKVSPHGKASYQLTLRYSGAPIEVALSFPQLFYQHMISLNGTVLSEGIEGARVSFPLTPGDHLLTVETVSTHGYYSGMYHPPTLGTTDTVSTIILTQCVAYGLAFFVPLTLALFTLALWRTAKDQAALWLGLLCCFFSLYVSYYFVRLFSLPCGEYWYLIQSAALYGLCFSTLRLTALMSNMTKEKSALWIQRLTLILAAVLLLLSMLTSFLTWAVMLHGFFTDLFYTFTFCSILFLVWRGRGRGEKGWEQQLTRLGCISFGAGLLYNLLISMRFLAFNLFEPLRFFWQFEWCALLLVALFGAMMVVRNHRILAENAAFRSQLEDMVQQRTVELRNLLKERKAFFSDMTHDLKAPISAAGSFIQAIREHNIGVDGELLRYIDLVEQKQQEMARRVRGLTLINKMDELSELYEPYKAVSVKKLLDEVYQTHYMEAEVMAIHLTVELPDNDGKVYAQPKKLFIMLENLLFNALKATPREGKITLWAELDNEGCHLSVADTGIGIPTEDIPHIFERFYVGKKNQKNGSGLGLYIVKSIVDSLNGTIYVSSSIGHGSSFHIDLPLMEE